MGTNTGTPQAKTSSKLGGDTVPPSSRLATLRLTEPTTALGLGPANQRNNNTRICRALQTKTPGHGSTHQWAGTSQVPQAQALPMRNKTLIPGHPGPCSQKHQDPAPPTSELALATRHGLTHQWVGTSARTTEAPQPAMSGPSPPTSILHQLWGNLGPSASHPEIQPLQPAR